MHIVNHNIEKNASCGISSYQHFKFIQAEMWCNMHLSLQRTVTIVAHIIENSCITFKGLPEVSLASTTSEYPQQCPMECNKEIGQ